MVKKKLKDETKIKYTPRLDDAANDVLIYLKKEFELDKKMVINLTLKNLPAIDCQDFFNHLDTIVKKNNQKPPVYISSVLLHPDNFNKLKDELVKAETYAIINNYRIPKEPSFLNYLIVKYSTEILIKLF